MTAFFITTLCISILGLSVLIGVKHWELSNGAMLGGIVRERANRLSHVVLLWVESIIPTLIRIYGKRIWRGTLSLLYHAAALLVVRTEELLDRTLRSLRHSTDARRGMGEASAFLREVAEHKKKLLRAESAQARVRVRRSESQG